MLVGRLTKENRDLRRVTVDFTPWLDSAETLLSFSTIAVSNLTTMQQLAGGLPVTPDTAPLGVTASFLTGGATMVQMFLNSGTAGMTYQLKFVATGSSTRIQTVELLVTIRGDADAVIVL